MDNASNNKTALEEVEARLMHRDIDFDAVDRSVSCFGHVIELCSKRVVSTASGEADDGDHSLSSDDDMVPSVVQP
jgi:hypothetical protein